MAACQHVGSLLGVGLAEGLPETVRARKEEVHEIMSASACCQTKQAMMEADAVEVKVPAFCRGGLKGS